MQEIINILNATNYYLTNKLGPIDYISYEGM